MKEIIQYSEEINKIIKKANYKIFGIGGFSTTRGELGLFIDNFELIYFHKTGDTEAVSKLYKTKFFKIKCDNIDPESKKPADVLKDIRVVKYINKQKNRFKIAIYVMKPSEEVEKICEQNGWILIANKFKLFKKFLDRNVFFEILQKTKIKRLFISIPFRQIEKKIDSIFKRFGKRIVIQLPEEGGGRGTFFFNQDFDTTQKIVKMIKQRAFDLEMKKIPSLIVSPFIVGPSIGVMGCVTKNNGVLTYVPRYQLIDISESIENKKDTNGTFCGHDWSLSNNLPLWVYQQTDLVLKKVGEFLKNAGYLGIFGIDFIVNQRKREVFPLELNPRLLGSFPVEIEVALQNKEIPLVAFHLLEFLKINYLIKSKFIYKKKGQKRHGSHLIIFNFFGKDIQFKKNFLGGVYTIHNGHLVFKKKGILLSDIKNKKEEFIITNGTPVVGRRVLKDRRVLRLVANRSISCSKGAKLNQWGKKIVFLVKKDILDSIL